MAEKVCKKCRKFGNKLFLKGERCLGPKCSFTIRSYSPGSHGSRKIHPRKSEYGLQLQAKQQAKTEYGIRERQFHRYFDLAARSKTATGEKLIQELETRLDNVIYRLGLARSRKEAAQIILHGKIIVNDKKINIPSYKVQIKDIIEPKNIKDINWQKVNIPSWLKFDKKTFKAQVLRYPLRKEIETPINEQLIVEFYSR